MNRELQEAVTDVIGSLEGAIDELLDAREALKVGEVEDARQSLLALGDFDDARHALTSALFAFGEVSPKEPNSHG